MKLEIVERSSFSRAASSSCVAAILLEIPLERSGLFQGVEVLALQVLDNGQLGHLAVVGLDHLDRHVAPAGLHRRPQPPLAGH